MARDSDYPSGILDDLAHPLQKSLAVEHRVGVDPAHVTKPRGVEPGIQRVRLPAVLLVHDDQVGVIDAPVGRPNGLGRKDPPDEHLAGLELECIAEAIQRPVVRPVVHDDHLELGVVEIEQRAHRRDDRRLFVVRGDDHAHGDREPRFREHVVVLTRGLVPPDTVLDERHPHEHDVQEVDEEQIAQAYEGDQPENVLDHAALTSSSSGASRSRASAAWRSCSPPAS